MRKSKSMDFLCPSPAMENPPPNMSFSEPLSIADIRGYVESRMRKSKSMEFLWRSAAMECPPPNMSSRSVFGLSLLLEDPPPPIMGKSMGRPFPSPANMGKSTGWSFPLLATKAKESDGESKFEAYDSWLELVRKLPRQTDKRAGKFLRQVDESGKGKSMGLSFPRPQNKGKSMGCSFPLPGTKAKQSDVESKFEVDDSERELARKFVRQVDESGKGKSMGLSFPRPQKGKSMGCSFPLPGTKAKQSDVESKFEVDDSERELARKFLRQVDESGGYDIDCRAPRWLHHPLIPLHPLDRVREKCPEFWEVRVLQPAHFAIEKINAEKGCNYKLAEILKVVNSRLQAVYLTFTAKDDMAHAVQTFQASVLVPFGGGPLELKECRVKPDRAAT